MARHQNQGFTKRKRASGSWEYIFKRKPLKKPLSMSFDSEEEGDEYARRLVAQLERGIVPTEIREHQTPVKTLADAVKKFAETVSVSEMDKPILARLRIDYSDTRLVDVDFHWIEAWIAQMKRVDQLAPSTIRHKVGALGRVLAWCVRKELASTNPASALPIGYSTYTDKDAAVSGLKRTDVERTRRLEDGEEDAIRNVLAGKLPDGSACSHGEEFREQFVLMFDIALETAMRMSEIYTLGAGQIDVNRRTIFLDRTKNGDSRQVPMSSVLVRRFSAGLSLFDGEAVFPWMLDYKGVSEAEARRKVTAKLSRQWVRIFEAAGCHDLGFHDLRHEATSRIYEKTKLTDLEIAKITGHKSLNMLRRYANLRASTLSDRLW